MEYIVHSHRHGLDLLENVNEYKQYWSEIKTAIEAVTEERLIEHFESNFSGKAVKSISRTINTLIDSELSSMGWQSQSPIFGESQYGDHAWRLDFAKSFEVQDFEAAKEGALRESGISIEVAFNHQGNISWNLLKPVIASEINHVPKAIQTGIGVVIAATRDLVSAGGFDNAVGTYENYISNLLPLQNLLTVPIVIVGLKAPSTFSVVHEKRGSQNYGSIKRA
jgi:hypothetical protein